MGSQKKLSSVLLPVAMAAALAGAEPVLSEENKPKGSWYSIKTRKFWANQNCQNCHGLSSFPTFTI